jgi:hypothetical protein
LDFSKIYVVGHLEADQTEVEPATVNAASIEGALDWAQAISVPANDQFMNSNFGVTFTISSTHATVQIMELKLFKNMVMPLAV